MGRNNYLRVGGAYGKVSGSDAANATWLPFTGIYYMSSKTKMTEISDGTSNTVAFGEYTGTHIDGHRDFGISWMGAGWLVTKWGLAPIYNADGSTGGNDYTRRQVGSKDTGIINFAVADGAVPPVSRSADFNQGLYATGAEDGRG